MSLDELFPKEIDELANKIKNSYELPVLVIVRYKNNEERVKNTEYFLGLIEQRALSFTKDSISIPTNSHLYAKITSRELHLDPKQELSFEEKIGNITLNLTPYILTLRKTEIPELSSPYIYEDKKKEINDNDKKSKNSAETKILIGQEITPYLVIPEPQVWQELKKHKDSELASLWEKRFSLKNSEIRPILTMFTYERAIERLKNTGLSRLDKFA